jgi:FKBP-type peptidyl-prolyl cis-trans isomerase FklB
MTLKKGTTLIIAIILSITVTAQDKPDSGKVKLETELDSVSYSLGIMVAQNMRTQGLEQLNYDAFEKGFYNMIKDKKTKISPEDAALLTTEYFKELKKIRAEKNLVEGKAFLEKNKEKKGVITLPSGLQYEVIKAGSGKSPKIHNKVSVHYEGRLLDGTIFDSSYERGKPMTFTPGGVIKAWREALTLMQTGSKWKLYVPSELGYGETGAGDIIGPNATLIFDIELLEVIK